VVVAANPSLHQKTNCSRPYRHSTETHVSKKRKPSILATVTCQKNVLYQPEQATKLLPEAPVCVISPALWPLVLKMTRSAPGVPRESDQHDNKQFSFDEITTSVSTRRLQWELLVRSSNEKVKTFVVVVRVRVRRATRLAVGLVVRVALGTCC
jgi:hypothetical protein